MDRIFKYTYFTVDNLILNKIEGNVYNLICLYIK